MKPGAPAEIQFRAFTIYTGAEECKKSRQPAELRVHPDLLRLKVGDRVHRTNVNRHKSELVIEAYSEDGEFLSAIPIFVSTIDNSNVTRSRSDWDYLEAIKAGEADLVVGWACSSPGGKPVRTHVHVIVTNQNESRD